MFHEFGHALHGMFASVRYPSMAENYPRDFVEFPVSIQRTLDERSNGFRALRAPTIKPENRCRLNCWPSCARADTFNQGYELTELLAAAELDLQWHLLPANAPLQAPDAFETAALEKTKLALAAVPPRYRSSYFQHIWASGYSAGYYAYLWSEMLDDDAWTWFTEHGGLTRANGDRLRSMVLSRGTTQDFESMYEKWRGGPAGD